MSLLLLRLLAAIVFIIVETVFFVALHTYFSHPVERMRNWFVRRNKRTVAILLPVLFVANFAVTFLFSGLITTAPETPLRRSAGVTRSFSIPSPERRTLTELIPTTPEVRIINNPRGSGNEQEPIHGVPADDTLQ